VVNSQQETCGRQLDSKKISLVPKGQTSSFGAGVGELWHSPSPRDGSRLALGELQEALAANGELGGARRQ